MAVGLPKKIGKYEVIDVIGKGGMGIVYRAKDPFLDRLVAIKIMTINSAEYPDLLDRFFREAKATASFQHPNIVTVYELGEHEGSPYLAMQYLEGASLEAIIRSHQNLTLLQKLDIIIQACHGLAYAHQLKVVHRDIKPGNIMVLKDGSVKIVDFGIARIGDTNFTRTGQFMGSLNYMSLEQLNEKLQVDQRTDVYSTGVVLYQFLTGALPFEAESTGATLMKILSETPPPFSKYLSSFPPELEAITLKALTKDRDQRYASADEFAIELTQLQDRLKQEAISGYLQQAELLLEKNELFQAHEQLVEVLKIDKQHTRAAGLLRSLRKQIEKEQSVERARQFKGQAEEAYRREEFESALSYLDQAISLDQTDVDLPKLRASVQSAKAEAEHLRQVLQRAENAHKAGNLDTAKQAIEEVLARRPNDTRVKSLYRMIQKELEERLKQRRLENLLEAARKEITNRRYTAAFDILKEAEKLDPDAPQLRALLDKFTTAREQEQRRRELEQVTRQIEQALNTDDHQAALSLVADGLRRFPNDPSLTRLRDLAETQKEAAQTKSYVRERVAAAQEILNFGNAAGALKVLEEALRRVPGNPHLESLVSMAQERLAQDRDEQAQSSCIQQANNALGRRDYAEAIQLLEAGQLRFAAAPEIDNLLRSARVQQSKEAKQQEIDRSVRRAHEFLRAQEYDRAIELLESILPRFPDDELRVVLEQARRRRDDLNRDTAAAVARAEQFLAEGSPAKALEFLQSQPAAYQRSEQFRELLQAATNQRRVPEPETPPSEPEWDAPRPSDTVFGSLDRIAPPPAGGPRVAPRVPARLPTDQLPPKPAPPQEPRGMLWQLTKQQKIIIAGIAGGVLLIGVVAMWMLSGSNGEKNKARVPNVVQPPGGGVVVSPPQPPAPTSFGTLSVRTNVEDVDAYIDSDPKRVVKGKKLEINLSVGDHEVRVEKQNYNQLPARKIHIDKDQAATLQFPLTPLTGPPSYFEITTTPGAKVSVDQVPRGTVEPNGKFKVQVEPSQHLIGLTLDGYLPWEEGRTAKPGQTLAVNAGLTLKQSPSPSVISFSASSEKIQQGDSVTLTWQTANAAEVSIPGVGLSMEASGSRTVKPSQTTTYTLTAKGTGQPATSSRAVTVIAAPPAAPIPAPSATLTAPSSVQQGQSVTLTWTTQNAKSVSIDPGIGSVDLNGQRQVSPTTPTTYTLTAKGADGSTVLRTARVDVTSPPTPQPQPPKAQPTTTEAAAIQDGITKFREAFNRESTVVLLKRWPTMSSEQKKQYDKIFKELRAIDLQLTSCTEPVQSGGTATGECTETISYTGPDGSLKSLSPDRRLITLKKTAGEWLIDSYTMKK
jgi:serine/threonine-protein kinase